MNSAPRLPRVLCIMGSGETAPTMSSVHAELLSRLGERPVPAVLLDTPFGFQENADDICARAVSYFRQSVGHPIEVASFRSAETATPREYEAMVARVNAARYVFAGPGSPTYALRQWRDSAVPSLLERKLREGGCVTFASAAAVSLGVYAVPVYEVYKVGEQPRWLDGLGLLGVTGLRAAVIPHYNNAEGGTHDTRYCYLGERRLRTLEGMLPDGVDVLGVDEHTACIFDLDRGTVSVRGRGSVTWRRRGDSRRFEAGTDMPAAQLQAIDGAGARGKAVSAAELEATQPEAAPTPFSEEVAKQQRIVDAALAGGDVDTMVEGLLAIDTQVHEWSSDTLDSDERDLARASLRQYVVRLGEVARGGVADPRERLAPIVDRLLALRRELRESGEYQLADRLRDVLIGSGLEVQDTPDGSEWNLRDADRAGADGPGLKQRC
jgi:cyanophycinase-like exopeptidase